MHGSTARKGVLARRTPRHCRDCEVLMVPRAKGYAPPHCHNGNGLCQRCYGRRRGDLIRRPGTPRRWRAVELLAEYEFWLRQGMTGKRRIAERIGVSFAALDRAIYRGRAYRRHVAEVGSAVGEGAESAAA